MDSQTLKPEECPCCDGSGVLVRCNCRASPWISVEERLPEDGERVLIADIGEEPEYIAYRFHGTWRTDERGVIHQKYSPTHWTPLPSPPESDNHPSG